MRRSAESPFRRMRDDVQGATDFPSLMRVYDKTFTRLRLISLKERSILRMLAVDRAYELGFGEAFEKWMRRGIPLEVTT